MSYLDLRDLAALLEVGGHADLVALETWSRDAGAYYCNEMFYRTLHAIRELGAPSEDGSSLIPASWGTGGEAGGEGNNRTGNVLCCYMGMVALYSWRNPVRHDLSPCGLVVMIRVDVEGQGVRILVPVFGFGRMYQPRISLSAEFTAMVSTLSQNDASQGAFVRSEWALVCLQDMRSLRECVCVLPRVLLPKRTPIARLSRCWNSPPPEHRVHRPWEQPGLCSVR